MRILVACEESGVVTDAFRKKGHDAISCDLYPTSGSHPEWHIEGDVLPLLREKWDMIIAFPPCTYLANVGSPNLFKGGVLNQERYKKGLEAKEFFMRFYNAACPKICIENPVASKIFELPSYTQIVQPYFFGHETSKKTCLWLKGLSTLVATNLVEPTVSCTTVGGWYNKGGKDRQKNRSKTFSGLAAAMAMQWG